MYRQIDFSTDYRDKQGRKYYKPPTYEIAKIIKKTCFENFSFDFKIDFLTLKIFLTPILQQGSLFQIEKLGEQKHIATFIFDASSESLILSKKYDEKPSEHDFSITDFLFSFLRPMDFVEILFPDVLTTGEKVLIKYCFTKAAIEEKSRVKKIKDLPDERIFNKILTFKRAVLKQQTIKKRGINYAKRTSKIR